MGGFPCENGLDDQNVSFKQRKQHEYTICSEVKVWMKEDFGSENGLDRQNFTVKQGVICSEAFSKQCTHKEKESLLNDKMYDETLSKKSRISHHYSIHEEPKKFICDKCEENFLEEVNFKIHICNQTKHKILDKSFVREEQINSHCRFYANEKPCDYDKLFLKDSLKPHHDVYTDSKPFICKICNKLFSRKDHLKLHNRIHTNDRPFMCEICGKLFTRMDKLKLHHQAHTKERTFKCNTCGKIYSRKDKLKLHQRVHSKIEPLYVMNAVKYLRGPRP